jgi:hypothetical protein
MTTSSDDESWEKTEAALSALITGKRRADGANWADAYSMSKHYLEVRLNNQIWQASSYRQLGTYLYHTVYPYHSGHVQASLPQLLFFQFLAGDLNFINLSLPEALVAVQRP